jgi:acyl-CoA thioesterase I
MWTTHQMDGEPLLFEKTTDEDPPTATLWFTPTTAPALTSSDGASHYLQGSDFLWTPGSRTLTLPPTSRIPFLTNQQLHPAPGSRHSMPSGDGQTALLYAEGSFFQQLQVAASYSHAETWTIGPSDSPCPNLPLTLEKLQSRSPLKIVILGDSISAGSNASAFEHVLPYQPPFPNLVADELQSHYHLPPGSIDVINLSVGGKNSAWAVTKTPDVIAQQPDLVIIAFGMNDAVAVPPDDFLSNIQLIVTETHDALPNCEFILVASMLPNPGDKFLHPSLLFSYRDQLLTLRRPGIEVADVTTLWQQILERKKFPDLTGNGINHPNDFSHRLYAQTILQLLE